MKEEELREYTEDGAIIVEQDILQENEIFDFSSSPYNQEFLDVFNFYKETLSKSAHYEVDPAYILYYNDRTVNARALKRDEVSLVMINAGLLVWLIENLKEKEEIHNILSKSYRSITESLDCSINELMYQNALHFTFYHELGHLVQKSNLLNDSLYENPESIATFDFKRHQLEMDADSFSALCMSTHLIQYIKKIFGGNINSDKVSSIYEIICTGLLLYLFSFPSFKYDIYYKEGTHPHPIIRILNILLTMIHYCNQDPEFRSKNIHLSYSSIIQNIINNASSIEKNILGSTNAQRLKNDFINQKNNILNYYVENRGNPLNNNSSAVSKWNQLTQRR